MALATASPDGMPSVRIVLLKGIDDRGLRFFTNYGSRKGRELDANPRAAVTMHWATMHRAVRAEGAVERLTEEESDAYFASRGRESRLGAWASRQGTPIPDRGMLEAAFADGRRAVPGRRRAAAGVLGRLPARARARSSSGRAARTACTTASTSCARPTGAGARSGSSP